MRNLKHRRTLELRIADCGSPIGGRAASLVRPIGNQKRQTRRRTGAVAVEFAFVAPVLLAVVLGMIEMGRAFEMKNLLEVAAREGARFASMDREGMLSEGQSTNQKMAHDIKNFLASNGVPHDDINVDITDYENSGQEFNLDDPANDLRLFEVSISIDYSDVSAMPVAAADDYALSASVVFRNGRATISQ